MVKAEQGAGEQELLDAVRALEDYLSHPHAPPSEEERGMLARLYIDLRLILDREPA